MPNPTGGYSNLWPSGWAPVNILNLTDMEEFWEWQLEDTGVTVSDLEKKGSVALTDKPVWWDRMQRS